MDWVPIISQLKSLVQYLSNDSVGATITQQNVSKQCIIISQCRSFVEYCYFTDGKDRATQTQLVQFQFLCDVFSSIPIIGHVKAIYHHLQRDVFNRDRCIIAATRTSTVMIGGIAGFAISGPLGCDALSILIGCGLS